MWLEENRGSYKWIIMLEKCGRPGINVFHIKWIIGNHGFFFFNLSLLLGSFDPEFVKNFRDSWNLPLGPKLMELKSLLQTLFWTLAVDFLTLAVLTQNKAVAKAGIQKVQNGKFKQD